MVVSVAARLGADLDCLGPGSGIRPDSGIWPAVEERPQTERATPEEDLEGGKTEMKLSGGEGILP